jgi:GNAT superfamily N-acetyltransferase
MISGGGYFFKCTDKDADGRILAVTSCFKPGGKQWKDDPAQDPGTEEEALPSCIKLSMHYSAIDAMKGARERGLKGNYNLWCKSPLIRMCFIELLIDLGSLATDRDYQGKGIGRMVMQWVIKQAGKDGLLIYLEATPTGRCLYKKLGFEIVEDLTFPRVMMHERECRPYNVSIMLRKPREKVE